MIGNTISHYRIIEELCQGGMGEVLLAEDTNLNRHVAIKVVPDEFAHDAERLARFQREAQVLASLNHPNIATLHEESGGKRNENFKTAIYFHCAGLDLATLSLRTRKSRRTELLSISSEKP